MGGCKGLGRTVTRLSEVSPYDAASGVGGVSGMMTEPAEGKINDVRYRLKVVEKGVALAHQRIDPHDVRYK